MRSLKALCLSFRSFRSFLKCGVTWLSWWDVMCQQQDLLSVIREGAGEWLTDLKLFDVYHGKGIDPDRKSLAVGLTWQHPSRTLNDDEVSVTTQNILTSLEQRFNATLRK